MVASIMAQSGHSESDLSPHIFDQAQVSDQELESITYDSISDEGHGRLDKLVLESTLIKRLLSHNLLALGKSLQAAYRVDVLIAICSTAVGQGMFEVDEDKATEFLSKCPKLGELVDSAWIAGKFMEVRRLSESSDHKHLMCRRCCSHKYRGSQDG